MYAALMQQDDPLEARFAELAADWRSQTGTRASAQARFDAMKAAVLRMRATGQWVSGPGDLLSILGRDRDELFHSRMLAWLLNPVGRHGFGDRFLRAFLDAAWPGEELVDGGVVEIELERSRAGTSSVTSELLESRADLIIRFESVLIVVENKLDAGEQERQCERLYWSWAGEPTEVRWLFLTPNGRAPVTTITTQAREAWRSMSYRQVRRALRSVLEASPSPGASPLELGRSSAFQYLGTLMGQGRR